MKKILAYAVALLLLVALVAAGLMLRHQRQQELAAVAAPEPAPWSVRTVSVELGRATRGFPALALVKGANEVTVSAQIIGILDELGPREGQRVTAGETLARINTRELENTLASLEAQREAALADAERKAKDAERARDLLKSRTISQAQVDQDLAAARAAQEQARSLESQIAAERTRIAYGEVLAPFAGVVAARLVDPGDLATAGKPLYRLIDTRSARLEVRLPAEILEQVAPGTEVIASHLGQQRLLHADRVFPSLDERSLGRLEIDVPELPFGLAPGALVPVRVITAAVDEALLVPADTLLPGADAEQGRVFKVAPGESARVRQIPVSIRLRGAGSVAVAGDLAPGDRLVTAHESRLLHLRDGDAVRIEGDTP